MTLAASDEDRPLVAGTVPAGLTVAFGVNLVFGNGLGKPIEPQNLLYRSYYPLLKRAGLPRSAMSNAALATAPPAATILQRCDSSAIPGLPNRSVATPSTADAPATPPT